MCAKKLMIPALAVLVLAAAALAEEAPSQVVEEMPAAAAALASDAIADASSVEPVTPAAMDEPAEAELAAVAPAEETALPAADDADGLGFDSYPPLGAVGYDGEGRRGRIHIVVRGDTLWDISDTYLGTSWVWPSIWQDNGEIENPHLIYPGNRIWITPSEMRQITAEEAASMLSNLPPEQGAPAATEELAFDEPDLALAPTPEFAPAISEPIELGMLRVSSRESVGLITPSQFEASASIVGRVPERVYVAQEDDVFIGLGESDVEVGDQFTAFQIREKVFDPDSGMLLGYHVEILGWLEVRETFPETSLANIRMSTGEMQEGVRVIPREPLPIEIPLRVSPEGVEGRISFFPQERVVIGSNDFVYLNRGTIDGLEVGSPLDVYRSGYSATESARRDRVLVPDFVIGTMVVVRAEAESSVALVTTAKTELALGDRFRGADH